MGLVSMFSTANPIAAGSLRGVVAVLRHPNMLIVKGMVVMVTMQLFILEVTGMYLLSLTVV